MPNEVNNNIKKKKNVLLQYRFTSIDNKLDGFAAKLHRYTG